MSLFRKEKLVDPQIAVDDASLLAANATAGGGQAALATVAGYIVVTVQGTPVKIPYFKV